MWGTFRVLGLWGRGRVGACMESERACVCAPGRAGGGYMCTTSWLHGPAGGGCGGLHAGTGRVPLSTRLRTIPADPLGVALV